MGGRVSHAQRYKENYMLKEIVEERLLAIEVEVSDIREEWRQKPSSYSVSMDDITELEDKIIEKVSNIFMNARHVLHNATR